MLWYIFHFLMSKEDLPFIIGIAGPTTSGKSTISEVVAKKLSCPIICVDGYFKVNPEMPVSYVKFNNFDKVEAIEWNILIEDIKTRYKNQKFLIVEGFLLFGDPEMEELVDILININYKENEMQIALERRLSRIGYKIIEDYENDPYETREKYTNFYFRKIAWPQIEENKKYVSPPNWKKPLLTLSATDDIQHNIEASQEFIDKYQPSRCYIC